MTNENAVLTSLAAWNESSGGDLTGTFTVGSTWWTPYEQKLPNLWPSSTTVYYPAASTRPWDEPCVEKAIGGWILHYHSQREVFTSFDALTKRLKKILAKDEA